MGPKVKSPRTTPINQEVKSSGVMRLSHGRMFHKRGLWLIEKWKKQNEKKPEDRKSKKASRMVTKEVKGEKNGKTRTVRVNRFVSLVIIFSDFCLHSLNSQDSTLPRIDQEN